MMMKIRAFKVLTELKHNSLKAGTEVNRIKFYEVPNCSASGKGAILGEQLQVKDVCCSLQVNRNQQKNRYVVLKAEQWENELKNLINLKESKIKQK